MKKKGRALGALLCAGIMCMSLAACGSKTQDGTAASFVSLDINPSVELTLDKNDKVISVYGGNEDGQVLLYQESGIVGADVEKAVEKITSLAVSLGYLDSDNAVVNTSVTGENAAHADKLLSKVNAKITATAGDLHLSVSCGGADAYSLLRKLEQLKAKYPDNAGVQALTPEKFKLILSATETGEISVEAAVELDTAELIQLVSDRHKEAEEFATAAYKQMKAQASAAYDRAVGLAMDGIYTAYYTTHYPLKAYYGSSYQGYKYSARCMYAVADALALAEKACEYPLDASQIAAASAALGLGDDVSALKNADGEITVNSIYAYADKTFKNSESAAQLSAVKEQLNAALNDIESQLQAEIEEASRQYEDEINAVKEQINKAAQQTEALVALIPDGVKEQAQAMVADCKDIAAKITDILSDGKISADEVRALADTLQKKADATLAIIENDLTKDEREEVKALQEQAANTLSVAKQQMEAAIAQAEEQAAAKLAELKAKRAQ